MGEKQRAVLVLLSKPSGQGPARTPEPSAFLRTLREAGAVKRRGSCGHLPGVWRGMGWGERNRHLAS